MRAEWPRKDEGFLKAVRGFYAAGQLAGQGRSVAALSRVDEISADFSPVDSEILRYSAKLTLASGQVRVQDVERLAVLGLSDGEISAVVMVVSCFSFMNRLADGTGVALQAERFELARDMFGDAALQDHLEWAKASRSSVASDTDDDAPSS